MSDQGRLVAGRYRLVESIGRGGMGTVWRAEDELLGRQVAVKKLRVPPQLHDDERERLYERTRREARSAARIAHPNVVVVHDVVEDAGLPCVVMEYVRSRTLSDVLKKDGPIAPREAARIGRGMVAALRAAHRAGVLHRDVKPANVLLGLDEENEEGGWPGGRVVLTDFGIASVTGTSTLTRTGELIGSFDYLAPERITGGNPGPASDLWALGATLYQAVEGSAPFHRDTPIETAYAIASEPVQPPRNAGPLTPLIESLLAKEPERRMTGEQVERLLVSSVETVVVHGGRGEAPTTAYPRPGVPYAGPSWAAREGGPDAPEFLVDASAAERAGAAPETDAPETDPPETDAPGAGSTGPDTGRGPARVPRQAHGPEGHAAGEHEPAPPAAVGPFAADGRSDGHRGARFDARPEAARDTHTTRHADAYGDFGHGAHRVAGQDDDPHRDQSRDPHRDPARSSGGRPARRGRAARALGVLAAFVALAGGSALAARHFGVALPLLGRHHGAPTPSPTGPSPTPQPTWPAGYHQVDDPEGFTMAVPDGWHRETRPHGEVDYIDPQSLVDLKISILDYAGPSPLQHWKQLEKIRRNDPQYDELRMNSTTTVVNGVTEPAAIWEWTWQGRVREYHAIDLGFGEEGGTQYAVYLSAPDSQWARRQPVFQVAVRTFRPTG